MCNYVRSRMANARMRRNYMQKIKVDGVWLTEEAKIKQGIT